MSAAMMAGLAAIVVAIIAVLVALVNLLFRARAMQRRIGNLQTHPTLIAAQNAQSLSEKLQSLPDKIASVRPHVFGISKNMTQFLAASASLRADVETISRATEDLLDAFVPSLRGSI